MVPILWSIIYTIDTGYNSRKVQEYNRPQFNPATVQTKPQSKTSPSSNEATVQSKLQFKPGQIPSQDKVQTKPNRAPSPLDQDSTNGSLILPGLHVIIPWKTATGIKTTGYRGRSSWSSRRRRRGPWWPPIFGLLCRQSLFPQGWAWVTTAPLYSPSSSSFFSSSRLSSVLGWKVQFMQFLWQKSRIRETLNLLTNADSSTDTTVGWTKNTPKPKFIEWQKKSSKTEKLKNV